MNAIFRSFVHGAVLAIHCVYTLVEIISLGYLLEFWYLAIRTLDNFTLSFLFKVIGTVPKNNGVVWTQYQPHGEQDNLDFSI